MGIFRLLEVVGSLGGAEGFFLKTFGTVPTCSKQFSWENIFHDFFKGFWCLGGGGVAGRRRWEEMGKCNI